MRKPFARGVCRVCERGGAGPARRHLPRVELAHRTGVVGSVAIPDWMPVGLSHRPRRFRSGVDHFHGRAIPDGVFANVHAIFGLVLARI